MKARELNLLLEYARQRLIRGPVLAAVLLVTAGAEIGRGFSTAASVATDLAIALCLVVAFRIWDDGMDRERDRVVHPERVVVRATSITSLWLAAAGLGLAGTLALLRAAGATSALLLIAFSGVLATWYRLRHSRSAAGERILLLKYPVFTIALIGPRSFTPRAAAGAVGVYLAACAYEWWHDRESPVFYPVIRLGAVSEPHDEIGAPRARPPEPGPTRGCRAWGPERSADHGGPRATA